MSYKWKPSKRQANEFAQKMKEIEEFCKINEISASLSNDSYYFTLNGQQYRVSNHTIEASNNAAYKDGVQIRDLYHGSREKDVVYIHAGKTRIIEIYNDLKAGYKLDRRGNRIAEEA